MFRRNRDTLEIALTKMLGKANSRVRGTGHVQSWANLTVNSPRPMGQGGQDLLEVQGLGRIHLGIA